MGNMSYCRFENTYNDLLDCQSALQEDGVAGVIEEADERERPYIKKLIMLCREIIEEFGDEDDIEDEDDDEEDDEEE